MHRLAAHHPSAVRGGERLVPEAHSEHRHSVLGVAADRVLGETCLLRRARARRHDHAVGAALEQLRQIVAHHLDVGPELAEVLDEVVGERVVVVDYEHARHAQSLWSHASRMASMTAPAFASVSRTSYAGSESATMPPPAWRCTRPSFTTAERMKMQLSRSPL